MRAPSFPSTITAGAPPRRAAPRPRLAADLRSVRRRLDPASVLLGGLILWFAGVHLEIWIRHPGLPVGIGQVLLELFQGALFFLRRREISRGRRASSFWLATTIGSWGFLAARPAGAALFAAPLLFATHPLFGMPLPWLLLSFAGTLLAILSLGCLGRSFGLLAGNRGVRTGGAYRFVRHPAYASYFITQAGYVLENLSLWNVAILAVVCVGQLWRIRQEEHVLDQDPVYQSYRQQVRFRLLPGVF